MSELLEPSWPTPGQRRQIIADTLPDPRPGFARRLHDLNFALGGTVPCDTPRVTHIGVDVANYAFGYRYSFCAGHSPSPFIADCANNP